jgi:serine phosphatase RsbU (regulator of sigma subunit)/CHASE3 domain sensor protein
VSVRKSAGVVALVGIALIVVFTVFLTRQANQTNRAVDDVALVYDPAADQAALLDTALSDMERGVASYLLTAAEEDLAPYVAGSRRSDLAVQQLQLLLADDPPLQDVRTQVVRLRAAWIEDVARPTIDTVRAGDAATALAVFTTDEADEAFLALQAETATLQALIEERRRTAFLDLADSGYRLLLAVVVTAALLAGSLLLAFALAHSRILAPLDDLRRQLRVVARRGEHTRTITPSGPVELHAVGEDVELLRRQLVSEIDEATAAREALEQKAPVVAAIRSELAAGSAVSVPGLSIHGSLQPAEGVLAGDWWDSTRLSTGEAAVVVADISGHGPGAGIAAMRLKYAIAHDLVADKDIDEVARSAAELFEDHPERFATVAAVCIDPDSGRMRYINAGHHPPLIIGADGSLVAELPATGPILSWLGGPWQIGTAQLQAGETVLLYSDGLIESHDLAGAELGEEQLLGWLAAVPPDQRAPQALVPWLVGRARERATDWDRDDVTVVAVRRDPPERAPTDSAGRGLRRRRHR